MGGLFPKGEGSIGGGIGWVVACLVGGEYVCIGLGTELKAREKVTFSLRELNITLYDLSSEYRKAVSRKYKLRSRGKRDRAHTRGSTMVQRSIQLPI